MLNEPTPRARRGARGSWTRLAGLAWALLLLLALPGAAWSETLYDLGAWAQVESDGEALGVAAEVTWGFVGDDAQVTQFLFLSLDPGDSMEPLGLASPSEQFTDTNSAFDNRNDTAVFTYGHHAEEDFGMQISLLLRGLPEEPQISDLAETIFVWNNSEDTTVYLKQLVELSLAGSPDGDEFVSPIGPGNTSLVRVVDGLFVFEEVVTPEAAFRRSEFGEVAFMMEWEIGPGETLLVSKDKALYVVPEPATAAMLGLGLLGLAILGRRRPH